MKSIPVCLFEDREECALGVKLLALSAGKHEPTWMIHAFVRNLGQQDLNWLASQPNVKLRTEIPTLQKGWNVKPSLLRLLLIETGGPVLWCDSDIILSSPVSGILDRLSISTFVATEEYGWGRQKGSKQRVQGWGFKESRPLVRTVNSCFMRMSSCHLPLLGAWDSALSVPDYVQAQSRTWDQRPLHLMGDQDVLTALLASKEHADIPLYLLRNGKHIAQCFEEDGYTVHDRLLNAISRRVPPLVHAQGGKPWKSGVRASYQQLSPYGPIALPYLKSASLPSGWVSADDKATKLMDAIAFRSPNLRGIFPAFARTSLRFWKHRSRLIKVFRS